jgi:hypothetical protein
MEVVYQAISSPGLSLGVPFDYEANPRTYKGEPQVERNINFKDFFKRLDSEKDRKVIAVLEKHMGNESNGGSSFRKVSTDMGAMIAVNEGRTFAVMPEGGLVPDDIERLQYLFKLKANMPPNSKAKAVKIMQEVFERFSIAGIAKVTGDTKPAVIYGRKLDLLETLEERGIWKDGDTEGEGHSGSGEKEDEE